MGLFSFFSSKPKQQNILTETERFVIEGLTQLRAGNDGDATYHPLYNAWCSYRNAPEQLSQIQDYAQYGTGLSVFLSYRTVTDINDCQQLASLAYLFISKAINNSQNLNHYKNRIVLLHNNHEALEYTVSSVVNKDQGFMFMNMNSFKARDAMYKMKFADLSTNSSWSFDELNSIYRDLCGKILSGFFGPNKTPQSIVDEGRQLHKDIFAYIENKVLVEGDIDF